MLAFFFAVLKLLALVAGGVALFVALCYGVLLHSLGDRPLPPRFIQAIIGEFLVSVAVILLWPLGWLRQGPHLLRRVAASSPGPGLVGPRRPVLLVHGYGMNSTSWVWFGRYLRRLGLGPLYTTTYFSLLSVERSAARLGQMIERVRQKEGGAQIDIIAHSLGGLVSRYYLETLAAGPGPKAVANLVTIGTPHRGTLLARFGLGPVAPQLRAESAFVSALGPPRPPTGVRYLSIFSTADEMVIPWESARLDPGGETSGNAQVADLRVDGLGHLALLCSPTVAAAAARALSVLEGGNAKGAAREAGAS